MTSVSLFTNPKHMECTQDFEDEKAIVSFCEVCSNISYWKNVCTYLLLLVFCRGAVLQFVASGTV